MLEPNSVNKTNLSSWLYLVLLMPNSASKYTIFTHELTLYRITLQLINEMSEMCLQSALNNLFNVVNRLRAERGDCWSKLLGRFIVSFYRFFVFFESLFRFFESLFRFIASFFSSYDFVFSASSPVELYQCYYNETDSFSRLKKQKKNEIKKRKSAPWSLYFII